MKRKWGEAGHPISPLIINRASVLQTVLAEAFKHSLCLNASTLSLRLQQNFKIEDEEDLRHDFERLQQAMEMVGFLPATKKQ